MDKKRLNNEIVLCRPAVRKARVVVIRKLIKKMKILKACKAEKLKEKKLRKSERLFEKVQIMKRVKDDEVTKFALRNKNLEDFLKGFKVNLRQNALACLAKHEAVMKKIKSIKEQIPNWEEELPALLDSLGKKKKVNKTGILKTDITKAKLDNNLAAKNKVNQANETVKENKFILKKSTPRRQETYRDDRRQSEEGARNSSTLTNKLCEDLGKIDKIDDPFFIEKKIIAPKLASASLLNRKSIYEEEKFKNSVMKEINNSLFFKKSFVSKNKAYKYNMQKLAPESKEEELHPSWAAKKIKLIKPFKGTKIKFTDD